jgi:hypothetical protein
MTHTELLNHIRYELKRQGVVWKKEQELFELLLPDEDWKKLRSTWYSWRPNKDGLYTTSTLSKSSHILSKISEKLFLDMSVWRVGEAEQVRAVEQGISEYVRNEEKLDLSEIIPQFPLSEEQQHLLEEFKKVPLINIGEKAFVHPEFFTNTFLNQAFLLALLNVLYARGAYEFLAEKVFPNLMSHQRSNVKVKMLEAHVLGCLKKPRYMEAVKLLESIKSEEMSLNIDLHTSLMSNLRRYHMNTAELNDKSLKEGVAITLSVYHKIYSHKENHHYYPAINLMYALVLVKALHLNTLELDGQKLYRKALSSIKKEKDSSLLSECYYASVSELEFFLLLGRKNVVSKMGEMLERLSPPLSYVKRTARQMAEFLAMANRLDVDLGEMKREFERVLVLMEDYRKQEIK